jgi:diguanylate cyclase (GGDEF)-like protein/PAS domain S-box-containing protein
MRRGDRSEVETAHARRPRLRRRATVLPWIVLTVFLGATLTAFAVRRDTVNHASRKNFDAATQGVTNGITTSLRQYEDVLAGVQRLKPANSPLTHAQFQQYATTVALPTKFPGLAALALIERVEPAQLQEFDRQVKADGGPGVRPTTRPDQVNLLVGQTLPASAGIGADIGEYAPADDAVNRARDTGKTALTRAPPLSKFMGVRQSPGERGMIVLAAPMYSTPRVPPTVAARRAHLSAVVALILSPDTLLTQATGPARTSVGVSLYDGFHTDKKYPLSTQPTPLPSVPAKTLRSTTRYAAFGQQFTLRYVALVSFASLNKNEPWLYLGAGLIVSLLLFALVWVLTRAKSLALGMVDTATETLRESEERFRALLADSSDILAVIGDDGVLTYANPAGTRLLGYDTEAMLGKPMFDLIHPDDLEAVLIALAAMLETGEVSEPVEFRMLAADGTWLSLEAVANNMMETPSVGGIVVNARDITQRIRTEADLRDAEERFRNAFEYAPIGMTLAGTDGRLLRVNQAYARMLGRSQADLVGASLKELTHPDDWDQNDVEIQRLVKGESEGFRMEKRYLHADGSVVWVSLSQSIVHDSHGEPSYMVGQVEDITEQRATGERLAHQAIHDPLTGLPNRLLFLDRLRLALGRAARQRHCVAVLLLDLDHFKVVNDSLGHSAGDRLLAAIADRMRGTLRPTDTVARFGGDEFVLLCDEISDEATARELADRVARLVARPVTLAEGEVFVTASIGIALSGGDRETPETLIRDADAAMYRAKENGRARAELFDERSHDRAINQLRTGNELHHALERGEFRVYYQPVIQLETNSVLGFEALVRWEHPERGLVMPGDFIGLAEESGLIVPIGAWVLAESCRQIARWQAAAGNSRLLTMSVNLSPRQLNEPTLPADVARILRETGANGEAIWLEITETTLMHDGASAILALRALRSLGVHLAVDDFGTGYSSLSYLKRFPVEALKVDQTFVDGLGRESEDTAIVTACVSLAHALGLVAVAEGVETPLQLAELRTLGCEGAQGYLFGHPQPAAFYGDEIAIHPPEWADAPGHVTT